MPLPQIPPTSPEFLAWFGPWPILASGLALPYTDPEVADLVAGVKSSRQNAIAQAALLMAPSVRPQDTLVPIPSHHGRASYTLELAQLIASCSGAAVADILSWPPHEPRISNPEAKLPSMVAAALPHSAGRVLLVDNLVATGATFAQAIKLIPKAIPFPLAAIHRHISLARSEAGYPLALWPEKAPKLPEAPWVSQLGTWYQSKTRHAHRTAPAFLAIRAPLTLSSWSAILPLAALSNCLARPVTPVIPTFLRALRANGFDGLRIIDELGNAFWLPLSDDQIRFTTHPVQ